MGRRTKKSLAVFLSCVLALQAIGNPVHSMLNVLPLVPGGRPAEEACVLFPQAGRKALRDGKGDALFATRAVGGDLGRKATDKVKDLKKVPLEMIDGGYRLDEIPDELLSPELREAKKKSAWQFQPEIRRPGLFGGSRRDNDASHEAADHGTESFLTIGGNDPFGMTSQAVLRKASLGHVPSALEESLNGLADGEARMCNLCVYTRDLYTTSEYYDKRKKRNDVILVAAAGNFAPHHQYANSNLTDYRAIVVGSSHPAGFPSSFSQEAKWSPVHIAVPTNHEVSNPSEKRKDTPFGRTSAAAPAVTGALINVWSILGSLTFDTAVALLKKTAIAAPGLLTKYFAHGHGILNAYKLVEVAKRLKALGWDKMDEKARLAAIDKDSVSDFTSEASKKEELHAPTLLEEGAKLINDTDCNKKKKGLEMIRQAFFLSAGAKDAVSRQTFLSAAALIARAYYLEGYPDSARYYLNMDPNAMESDMAVTAAIPQPIAKVQDQGFLARAWGSEPSIVMLPPASAPQPVDERIAAVRASQSRGADASRLLLRTFKQDKDDRVRWAAAIVAANLAAEGNLPDITPLRIAFDDWKLRPAVLHALRDDIPIDAKMKLLEELFADAPPLNLKTRDLTKLIDYKTGKRGLEMLYKLSEDRYNEAVGESLYSMLYVAEKDPEIYKSLYLPTLERVMNGVVQTRRAGVMAVPSRKEQVPVTDSKGAPYYKKLLEDPEESVRELAVMHFGHGGPPEVVLAAIRAGMKESGNRRMRWDTVVAMMGLLRESPKDFKTLGKEGAQWLERYFDRKDDYGKKFYKDALEKLKE